MEKKKSLQQSLSTAIMLHQAGSLNEAEALYQTILLSYPTNPDALSRLGTLNIQRGNHEEAVRLIRASLKVKSSQPYMCNNLGYALQVLKRPDEALKSFDEAIALKLDYAEAYLNRGVILYEMKRYDEALASYDKAIALKSDHAGTHNNRGLTLHEMRRYTEALASYDKALAFKPDYAEAHNNRGNTLQELKRYAETLASYDKALAFKPDYAFACNGRGIILQKMRRYAEALASYDKAIALKPDYAEAYSNRGNTLVQMKQHAEALASFEKAIALKPDIPYLIGALLHAQMHLCNWRMIDHVLERLEREIEAGNPALPPFTAIATSLSLLQQRNCTEIYVKNKFPPHPVKLWNGERYAHAKIRVAYVSADFREHALAFLMTGVFERHDKTRFESYGISLAPEDREVTGQRVKAAFDRFIDVSQKSDQEVARLLYDLEIDIAVDLMGFTLNCRTDIFAWRPAPIHINYLGYPATMRADYIDYIIADAFVIPPQSLPHYAEKVVYLPDCFQANDDKRFISKEKPSRIKYGLPEEGFVFCSFNNSYKITPVFFNVWMRLLKTVPGSVLWLLGNDAVQHNLRVEAGNRGVNPSRLIFATRVKYEEHLARLRNADLFLDTLPFNAGATASDVLWAGVPLVTCAGQAFAARMAGSLLTAVGLPELITESLGDYEALALELATHPERLATIKAKLAQNRETSPLFNTALFTRHLEDAYSKMWERSEAGLSPDNIYVQA